MNKLIEKIVERIKESSRTMMPVIPTEEAIKIIHEEAKAYNESPKTNADYIRNMSDEELAEWIDETVHSCGEKLFSCKGRKCSECTECYLDWLKAEREG